MARAALYYGSILPRKEIVDRIMAVSGNDLREAADNIYGRLSCYSIY